MFNAWGSLADKCDIDASFFSVLTPDLCSMISRSRLVVNCGIRAGFAIMPRRFAVRSLYAGPDVQTPGRSDRDDEYVTVNGGYYPR